jgi:hypothetical protein
VTFKRAVELAPDLKEALHGGLRALRRADRQHVAAEDTRLITGSVDIENCLKDKYPNNPQWDYAIGHRPKNRTEEVVYWIEVHPASQGRGQARAREAELAEGVVA